MALGLAILGQGQKGQPFRPNKMCALGLGAWVCPINKYVIGDFCSIPWVLHPLLDMSDALLDTLNFKEPCDASLGPWEAAAVKALYLKSIV